MPPFCAAAKTVLATSAATATPAPAPPTCLAIKLVIVLNLSFLANQLYTQYLQRFL